MMLNFHQRQAMRQAVATKDEAEIGRIVLTLMKTDEQDYLASINTKDYQAELELRADAVVLIKPVEQIYNAAYKGDERISRTIQTLVKVVLGHANLKQLAIACAMTEQALGEAAIDAEECPTETVNIYWAAADAAEVVAIATRPVVDMRELKSAVEAAIKWQA